MGLPSSCEGDTVAEIITVKGMIDDKFIIAGKVMTDARCCKITQHG
jgi:hypothetical protein